MENLSLFTQPNLIGHFAESPVHMHNSQIFNFHDNTYISWHITKRHE